MAQTDKDSQGWERAKIQKDAQPPQSFEEAVKRVEKFALLQTQKSAHQKQLYYHNGAHVNAVKQRADKIFKAIVPFVQENLDSETAPAQLTRMKYLLNLSALAHDMIQDFIPQNQPQTSRLRSGASEAATISLLIDYIEKLNKQILQEDSNSTAIFTESDIQTLKEAIEATVCAYDPSDACLYQPLLYNVDKEISLPALILALADLGGLGVEGIEAYLEESTLIFLEENPDIIPAIWNGETQKLVVEYDTQDKEKQELYERIRQRLLRRARFQVKFAKGRFSRFDREVGRLPSEAIQALKTDIFKYLNPETIQKIESLTPTSDETTLQELIEFFQLRKYLKKLRSKLSRDSLGDSNAGLPPATLKRPFQGGDNAPRVCAAIANSIKALIRGFYTWLSSLHVLTARSELKKAKIVISATKSQNV